MLGIFQEKLADTRYYISTKPETVRKATHRIGSACAIWGVTSAMGQTGPRALKLRCALYLRKRTSLDASDATSTVITLKLASVQGPNEVTIATSVASRPRAIRMRPMRGML